MTFTDRFTTRPLSHSQLSSWEYNKDEWWDNYILGKRKAPNPAMEFGTVVGDSIGTPGSLVPALIPPGVKEFELSANLGPIRIVGYADHYCPDTRVLHENKTSDNPTRWDQKKVDGHGQLTMYALMLYLRDKVKPEEIQMFLNFIPVERGSDMVYKMPEPVVFHQFKTKRTTLDIVNYGIYIKKTVAAMEEYYNERIKIEKHG